MQTSLKIPSEIDELKAAIAVGLDEADRGLSIPWDVNAIANEIDRRWKWGGQPADAGHRSNVSKPAQSK